MGGKTGGDKRDEVCDFAILFSLSSLDATKETIPAMTAPPPPRAAPALDDDLLLVAGATPEGALLTLQVRESWRALVAASAVPLPCLFLAPRALALN